jgi:hypothetical protein
MLGLYSDNSNNLIAQYMKDRIQYHLWQHPPFFFSTGFILSIGKLPRKLTVLAFASKRSAIDVKSS